jgi:alpha-galactosidase
MYIPARYGLFQIIGDTCGPAGMMMGFRSIPAYMRICREMEKRCPRVVLVSHSNPMAVLCRAMVKYSNIRVIGICHGVQGTIEEVGKVLGVPPAELECTWIGTNHYYWVLKVAHKGVDIFGKVMEGIERRGRDAGKGGKAEALFNCLSRAYGYPLGYPHDDHVMEFYPFPGQVRSQSEYPPESIEAAKFHGFDASKPMPRREKVTPAVRKAFFKDYQSILTGVQLPTAEQENSFTREGVAAMIAAISRGRREVFITNIPNAGAVPNLPATGLLEVEAVTGSTGVRGITVGDCPPVLKGILEKRLAWHELVADAAVQGDRNLALQALLLDEMAIRPDKAEAMLDELLAASKDLLGQFFRK